jgi:hypothetical protein
MKPHDYRSADDGRHCCEIGTLAQATLGKPQQTERFFKGLRENDLFCPTPTSIQ